MEPILDVMPARGAKPYRLLVGGMAAALAVAGIISIPHIHPVASAAEVLADARAFVKAHPTARYTGNITETFKDDADKDLGSSTTMHGRVLGEIQNSSRFREVRNAGSDGVEEALQIGDTMYIRDADSVAGLTNAQFAKFEMTGDDAASSGDDDFDALAVLNAARFPETVSRHGNVTTISADVDPVKAMSKEVARGIDSFRITMAVADGGEVQTIEEHVKGDGGSAAMQLAFKDWGELVQIAEPRADQIDATPGIAEEAIAVWKDAPLYEPKAIPAGWALDYADVLSKDDTPEGCEQVELDIDPTNADMSADDAPYLYIYELPTSCAQPFGGPGVVPFNAGRYSGFVQTDGDGYSLMQMTLDDKTTLQADTNMTPTDLSKVLTDLVPLDLGKVPAALVGVGLKALGA